MGKSRSIILGSGKQLGIYKRITGQFYTGAYIPKRSRTMKYKLRGHETFAIRKGWLSKGMKRVQENGDVFLSKTENPMDVLGIGANMVKSLRYWLQAVGLTKESETGRRTQTLTPFGKLVLQYDRYIEEAGTLQLLHYKLASNKELAPSWYYFFNEYRGEISESEFEKGLESWLAMEEQEPPSRRLVQDDFACIISTYLPRHKSNPEKDSPESNLECPLAELGLIDFLKKSDRTYKKLPPPPKSLHPWIVLAAIVDAAEGKTEIQLHELSQAPRSISRIFNLDTIALLEVLYQVEGLAQIKLVRTAGLDVIQIMHPDHDFLYCVDQYYKAIKE